jgi:biopolymer transport protein ExbD
MQFTRHKREAVSLNLTPLIDVVFLLLIFFMVTTTFTKESRLTLELPEAEGKPGAATTAEMLEVTVSATGEFAVNGNPLVNTKIETVKRAITEASKSDTSIPMVITADAQAPHQSVVTAMDAAGQLGFVHLNITTMQPQQ